MPYSMRGFPLSIIKSAICSLLMLVAVGVVVMAPQQAQAREWQPALMYLAQVDSAGAARIVERNTGGKVLSVHRQEKKGKVMYRVKVLLPEGRVRTVSVDAETGQMRG